MKATGLQRPERGTIGKSAACRDYPMSTDGEPTFAEARERRGSVGDRAIT